MGNHTITTAQLEKAIEITLRGAINVDGNWYQNIVRYKEIEA